MAMQNSVPPPWSACGVIAIILLSLPAAAGARELDSKITVLEQIPRIRPEYKVPDDADMLFYVERSVNSNTVVYAANRDAHGAIDASSPVVAFWRWFNVDGHKKDLNFIERMMAYGVRKNPPGPRGQMTFKIAALPERTLTLDLDENGRPEALIQIGARTVKLAYVYLQVVDGLVPSVPALDIFGTDKASGKAIQEHIVQD
jgi:hypothetical protein